MLLVEVLFKPVMSVYHCEGEGAALTKNKLLLDKESVSENTGTYYGNYFGLIYARLYKNEGN